jgi:hypothetical protein
MIKDCHAQMKPQSFMFEKGQHKWFHPATLDELLAIMVCTLIGFGTGYENSKV